MNSFKFALLFLVTIVAVMAFVSLYNIYALTILEVKTTSSKDGNRYNFDYTTIDLAKDTFSATKIQITTTINLCITLAIILNYNSNNLFGLAMNQFTNIIFAAGLLTSSVFMLMATKDFDDFIDNTRINKYLPNHIQETEYTSKNDIEDVTDSDYPFVKGTLYAQALVGCVCGGLLFLYSFMSLIYRGKQRRKMRRGMQPIRAAAKTQA